jgi:ribonuclease J
MTNGEVLTFQKGARPSRRDRVQAGAVLIDGNAVGEIKSRVMKERRELAEDGIIAISATVAQNGTLLAPVSVESRGFFVQDEDSGIFDEIRAAAERVLKELSGGRMDAETVSKSIKSRVREVVRRRSASYAVVMPLISVAGEGRRGDKNWLEKEFF